MKKFYAKTEVFWIISRLMLILLYSASLVFFFLEFTLDFSSIFVVVLMVFYLLAMILTFLKRILDKTIQPFLRSFTGGVSILFACLMVVPLVQVDFNFEPIPMVVSYLLPIWLLLFGIRDIMIRSASPKEKQVPVVDK